MCEAAGGQRQIAAGTGCGRTDTRKTPRFQIPRFEVERKTVTMLFADIKGPMDLLKDLDPEKARAIVDPALRLKMQAVQRYGAMLPNPPATASSPCSAHRSRMKTTPSARSTLRCACRKNSNATRTASALKAAFPSGHAWV